MGYMRRRLGRNLARIGAAGALIAAASGVLAGTAAADSGVSCHLDTGIPVALAAGQPANYRTNGELCATAAELRSGETVQLLIHGATYDHRYWDFGTFGGESYSYARALAADGYPTFAIDEIGTADTTPIVPSADVTLDSVAYVAHEIVQDLLAGRVAGTKFGKVIEVGHSQGSATTWQEAATYHDVAGVIITGATHSSTFVTFATGIEPATLDPDFAASGVDAGYVTTVPGARERLFYNSSDSDPAVIAHDEATKNILSAVLFASDASALLPSITRQIDVPVLVIMGSKDSLFCGAGIPEVSANCTSGQGIATDEAPDYSAAAQLRACMVPGSGHDINLALNHDIEEQDALSWSNEYIGQQGQPADQSRALPSDCSS